MDLATNNKNMSIIDLIKRRKNISYRVSDGLTLATHTINEFEDRTFTFKGLKNKYSKLKAAELLKLIQEEIDAALIVYHFTTKIKKYADRIRSYSGGNKNNR